MRLAEWLYRHAAWLNLIALIAVFLWVSYVGTTLFVLYANPSPQPRLPTACVCKMPDAMHRTASRI
jgi:hypothetical protein